jgi:hypothetical protein
MIPWPSDNAGTKIQGKPLARNGLPAIIPRIAASSLPLSGKFAKSGQEFDDPETEFVNFPVFLPVFSFRHT